MDKQQFHEQLTKTSKALLRERVNNARGVFDFLIFDRKNKKVDPGSKAKLATGQENL